MHTMIGTIIIELQLQVHWYSLNFKQSYSSKCQIIRTIAVRRSCIFRLCHHPVQNIKKLKVLINPMILNMFWLILCWSFIPLLYQVYVRKRENVKLNAYTAVQMCKQAVKSSVPQLSSIPRTAVQTDYLPTLT